MLGMIVFLKMKLVIQSYVHFFDVQLKEDESFVYKKGIIELTQFGKDFLNSVR